MPHERPGPPRSGPFGVSGSHREEAPGTKAQVLPNFRSGPPLSALSDPRSASYTHDTTSGGKGIRVSEPSQVINHLVKTLSVAPHEATSFVEVMHEIVEEQATDDVSVVAPPL